MHYRCSLAIVVVLTCTMLCGCRSGELYDPTDTSGRIAGELTIVGPVDTGLDLQIGLTRINRDDTVAVGDLGRLVSATVAKLEGRVASYDFSALPIGSYNLILFTAGDDGRRTYYRSERLRLTPGTPQRTGLTTQASLTGPAPWGSAAGTLFLSGTRPRDPMLQLFVTDGQLRNFHYDFNAWDAGFGVMYFVLGGLSYGEYAMGISDPPNDEILGQLTTPLKINTVQPNPADLQIWSEYPDQSTTGDGYSLGGTIIFDTAWPEQYDVAVIAIEARHADIGTSPIFHVRPRTLDAGLRARFYLGSLSAGDYTLNLYALDFLSGNHRKIGVIETPLVLDEEQPFQDDLLLRGDIAGLNHGSGPVPANHDLQAARSYDNL